jgi:hypothetical protein
LSKFPISNGVSIGKMDTTLCVKTHKNDVIIVLIYVLRQWCQKLVREKPASVRGRWQVISDELRVIVPHEITFNQEY